MEMSRYGIVQQPNNLPHISGAGVHGDTVYLQGGTPDPGGGRYLRSAHPHRPRIQAVKPIDQRVPSREGHIPAQ